MISDHPPTPSPQRRWADPLGPTGLAARSDPSPWRALANLQGVLGWAVGRNSRAVARAATRWRLLGGLDSRRRRGTAFSRLFRGAAAQGPADPGAVASHTRIHLLEFRLGVWHRAVPEVVRRYTILGDEQALRAELRRLRVIFLIMVREAPAEPAPPQRSPYPADKARGGEIILRTPPSAHDLRRRLDRRHRG
jgi:hypothetical protein